MATEIAAGLRIAAKEMHGIVVSAGLMDKTVKWFKQPRYKLVHDPRNSLRQGDVVAITTSWRESQHVRHVVKHIIAPYGPAIDERPPIPTMGERAAERAARRQAKDAWRALHRGASDAVAAAQKMSVAAQRLIGRAAAAATTQERPGADAAPAEAAR